MLGALVGFEVGRRWGKPALDAVAAGSSAARTRPRPGAEFFEKHGSKAVFLGRFVPVVRSTLGWMAGIGEMRFAGVLVWNVLGATAWDA